MKDINISCESIIEEYADLVYRVALSQVKNKHDAEDIFQEVFISLIKNLDKIEDEAHLKHWLIRSAINRAKNYRLCFWHRRVELKGEDITYCAENEEWNDIIEEIQSLPAKLRAVVYLHYYEGFSAEETGKILKIPEGTVKSRLYTARKRLKMSLGEGEER